ncbi:aromatic acid exporter family protein [Micromonospora sp. NPDC005299]|uniref:FUSC family protein n=1 Tax=Micromonospora sp. NPDC005299 TaxID=3364231 RepID=UPI0036AE03CD
MAADRGDLSRRDAAAEHAKGLAVKVRRSGAEGGRLRLRLFEIILLVAVQCGLAAALSWWLAHEVLGRPAPVFAPSAAVGTIVGALGQRARRTAELLLGVGLGLLVSDLLVRLVGFGFWQIGLVVALSIAVALTMTGRSGALVAQAGGTAVLIATFAQAEQGLEWARIVDAGVGGLVGLVVVALLLPVNPMRILDRATAPVVATLRTQLREVAHALAERDPDRAMRALDQFGAMEPDLERMHEALGGAEEVVTIAPARWRRRIDVEHYRRGIQHIDRVALGCLTLARWAATTLQYDEPVPEELPCAVERLAEAIHLLAQEARAGRPFEQTRNAVSDGACLAGRAYHKGRKPFSDAIVVQLRTVASDLLRATGCEPEAANRMVREAAIS